jgi:hypothetical protein
MRTAQTISTNAHHCLKKSVAHCSIGSRVCFIASRIICWCCVNCYVFVFVLLLQYLHTHDAVFSCVMKTVSLCTLWLVANSDSDWTDTWSLHGLCDLSLRRTKTRVSAITLNTSPKIFDYEAFSPPHLSAVHYSTLLASYKTFIYSVVTYKHLTSKR